MIATRWWSVSKGTWIVLEDMVTPHLRHAFAKFERGGYRVPDGDPSEGTKESDTRVPSDFELAHLKRAFASEFERRGLDASGNEQAPPPQDEGFA